MINYTISNEKFKQLFKKQIKCNACTCPPCGCYAAGGYRCIISNGLR